MPLPGEAQDSSSEYDSLPEISLTDVYDLASEIGKEFEKMINLYGDDLVRGLMPKVVGVLELLERVSNQSEQDRLNVEELRHTVALLQQEKSEKAADRLRYEQEIEQLEESWKAESRDLLQSIGQLQDQNRKLQTSLRQHRDQASSSDRSPPLAGNAAGGSAGSASASGSAFGSHCGAEPPDQRDWELFEKMRELGDRQREQLRISEQHLRDRNAEAEQLQSQVERLQESNKELRRKNHHGAQKLHALAEERAELHAQLLESSKTVAGLSKRLGLAQRDNQDLVQFQSDAQEKEKTRAQLELNDPNKPRFTICELKEILRERNELKARVSDLEDELAIYRPTPARNQAGTVAAESAAVACEDWTPLDDADAGAGGDGDDLPVQGPLPFEPEDAPWRRLPSKKSGIRKLFSSLPRFLGQRPL